MKSLGNNYYLLHAYFNEYFYYNNERHLANDDFHALIDEFKNCDIQVHNRNVWCNINFYNSELPYEGFKIHISATILNAKDILKIVFSYCMEHKINFKFIKDMTTLKFMNDKRQNRSSAGKFITIYPINNDNFKKIIDELYHLLKNFDGPYILSDNRYGSRGVVFYRYGSIKGRGTTKLSGDIKHIIKDGKGKLVEDKRLPYFYLPDGIVDPFESDHKKLTDTEFIGKDYFIQSAVQFSVTGGVYNATDTSNNEVIIKEARSHTFIDDIGNDAVVRLKKEQRILHKLKCVPGVVNALDIFKEWDNYFLVLEKVKGVNFQEYFNNINPLINLEYNKNDFILELNKIILKICEIIREVHLKDIKINDVSPNNILIEDSNNIKLIDFEAAFTSESNKINLSTLGYSIQTNNGFVNDISSIGFLIMSALFPMNSMYQSNPKYYIKFLDFVKVEFNLNEHYINIIKKLIHGEYNNLDTLIIDIEATIPFHTGYNHIYLDIPNLIDLESLFNLTFKENLSNSWFPNDPTNYIINPFNISYGITGIYYSQLKTKSIKPKNIKSKNIFSKIINTNYPDGLLYGSSGIAWFLIEMKELDKAKDLLKKIDIEKQNKVDMANGLAGIGMSTLKYYQLTCDKYFLDRSIKIADLIIDKSHNESDWIYWIENEGYIGYYYGGSGIALFLLYMYKATKQTYYLNEGYKALVYDLNKTVPFNNYHSTPLVINGDINTNVVTHYQNQGTAGIFKTLIRYLKEMPNDDVLNYYYSKLSKDLERVIVPSVGLLNGITGISNVLLDAMWLLEDYSFEDILKQQISNISLYTAEYNGHKIVFGDKSMRFSLDYLTGVSGVNLVLDRYRRYSNGMSFEDFDFTLDENKFDLI